MYDLLPYFVFLGDLILHMFTQGLVLQTKVVNMDVQLLCDSVLKQLFIYQISFCMNVSIHCMNFSCKLILKKTFPPLRKDLNSLGNSPKFSCFFSLIEPHRVRRALSTILIAEKHADLSISLFPRQNSPIVFFCQGIIFTKTDFKQLSFFPLYWDYM